MKTNNRNKNLYRRISLVLRVIVPQQCGMITRPE